MARGHSADERLTRDELALMAAFEARTGDGATNDADVQLSADLSAELDDFVALSQRIAALDEVPPVSPSVRSVILSAAAAQTQADAEPKGLAKWLLALLRPGPMAALGIAAAVLLAVAVRPDVTSPLATEDGDRAMVAMKRPAAAAAKAVQARAEPRPADPGLDAAPVARPKRTIAATPASVGPGGEQLPGPAEGARAAAKDAAPPAAETDRRGPAPAVRVPERAAREDVAAGATKRKRAQRRPVDKKRASKPTVWSAGQAQIAAKSGDELSDKAAMPAAKERAPKRQQLAAARAAPRPAPSRRATNYLEPTKPAPSNDDFAYAAADRPSSAPSGVRRVEREAASAPVTPRPSAPAPRSAPDRLQKRAAYKRLPAKRPAAKNTPRAESLSDSVVKKDAARDSERAKPTGGAKTTGSAEVATLKARYAKAKSDGERSVVLRALTRAAKGAGDTVTLRWAQREAKRVDARLAAARSAKRPTKAAAPSSATK